MIINGILEGKGISIEIDESGIIYKMRECTKESLPLIKPRSISMHLHLGETIFFNLEPTTLNEYLRYGDNFFSNHREDRRMRQKSEELAIELAFQSGIRGAVVGRITLSLDEKLLEVPKAYPLMESPKLNHLLKNFSLDQAKRDGIKVLWLHSIYRINEEILKKIKEWKGWISIHASETKEEFELVKREHGLSPIQLLDELKILGPKTILANVNYVDDEDIKLIKERGSIVSVSPISNFWLKNRLPPLDRFFDENIPPNISTDGIATGRSFSQYKIIKTLSLLTKYPIEHLEKFILNPHGLFTRQPKIEEGQKADFVLLDKSYNPKGIVIGNRYHKPNIKEIFSKIKLMSEKLIKKRYVHHWPRKYLLIDWGNTLIIREYPKDLLYAMAKEITSVCGKEVNIKSLMEAIKRVKSGRTEFKGDVKRHQWGIFEAKLLEELGCDSNNIDIEKLSKRLHTYQLEHIKFPNGVRDLFEFARNRKMKIIIVSNGNSEKFEKEFERFPYKDYIDRAIISDNVGGDKITGKPYELLEKEGIKVNESIMIGDRWDEDGKVGEYGGFFIYHTKKDDFRRELEGLKELDNLIDP